MNERFADAVVVAAGSSERMGGADKLAADLAGRPVLAWSLGAMTAARSVRRIVLVAAPAAVAELAATDFVRAADAVVVAGGLTRSESVLAGVRATDGDLVLIHDGARPLVSPELIDGVAAAAARHGAAIPVVRVADSVKGVADGAVSSTVARDGLVAAQTPQGARRDLLLAAFDAAGGASFSDEAALLTANGVTVSTIPGDVANFKVTTPADLALLRLIAAGGAAVAQTRTGFGQDSHQFGRLDGLWLGGTFIAEAPRLHGHSDGDVALHAIATGLLSAAGLGDLGRLFPAGAESTRGASSLDLLGTAVDSVGSAGWRPASIDVALSGSRPRLGPARLDGMKASIAAAVAIAPDAVSVTASTGNLGGPDGSGLSISATALVTLARS